MGVGPTIEGARKLTFLFRVQQRKTTKGTNACLLRERRTEARRLAFAFHADREKLSGIQTHVG